ncbi:MAG TPA: cob(I)yrinic acid a,c-diamide adenosyltransferase [Deltaproteobacteria bacterium]|nr:cob(I)yrinic acid a,c-diamide adenosyltransferase [Deltaproteobacteria bacterium]NMD40417.1 cob(I)yrinic acid a,c-diamide adenosyltransferase [Deltaproteobacteria bacterium]HNQ84461.1 cob(I)yrinic acid a,c-diamide adenosyltransferase [Deltaproteobacteria bacterium]HNS90182.1 cob(I)yrinic acid a,c-diamide adenosyltransferase [Deltaproteobacteria bacterium]HOA44275.1 cob(I)yrinic acid a,c-diamide adenosyltransferase [Deltaproteobacteria bacterium]
MAPIGTGCVHIYTGNGKGKTTAALGLALRAAGRGLKTCIVQFMKGRHYGELDAVKMTGGLIIVEQFGHPEFCSFGKEPDPADVERAASALERIRELMDAKACDILVADEMTTACLFRLITEDDVLAAIASRPGGMELVITGRGATQRMIEAADLVTEMREVKHYYTRGIDAREGIES